MNPIHLPEDAVKAIAMLEEQGFEAYAVGGFVRDSLLGRHPSDIDLATNALPEEIESVFSSYTAYPPMKKFGTVPVSIHGGRPIEITTYRSEKDYYDHRHPGEVSFVSSLGEDLARRDFTVNALAYREQTGLIDLFGGLRDLEHQILRPVGQGKQRFQEDALRMLRAFRFQAQLGFSIPSDVQDDIRSYRELLKSISAERIQEELSRLLASPFPSEAMALLLKLQVLDWVFPFQAAESLAPLNTISDAGFPVQLAFLLAPLSSNEAENRLSLLKPSRACASEVRLLLTHRNEPTPIPAPRLKRLLREFSPEWFHDYCRFSAALRPSEREEFIQAETAMQRIFSTGDCYDISGLAVDGTDLVALGLRGPEIGRTLEHLLDEVVEGRVPNEKELLRQEALRRRMDE